MLRLLPTIAALSLAACTQAVPAPPGPLSAGPLSAEPSALVDVRPGAGGGVVLTDRSGKGAVLCSWSVLVLAQEVGRRCPALREPALQTELDRTVAKVDAFILANSSQKPTRADLARWKARTMEGLTPAGLCAGEPLELYMEVRKLGPSHIRASTNDLLSIPREPVMNPCF